MSLPLLLCWPQGRKWGFRAITIRSIRLLLAEPGRLDQHAGCQGVNLAAASADCIRPRLCKNAEKFWPFKNRLLTTCATLFFRCWEG